MARALTKEQVMSNAYYDTDKGFGSIRDTLKQAKEKDPSITIVDVNNFMAKQPNTQIRKYRGSNSYTAPFAGFEYQMDMAPPTKEPETKMPKKNEEPRYALIVIDIFSKYANVVPMTNNDGKSVLSALKDNFKIMGRPMSIYSDDDGGFKTVVKEYFEAEGITHHYFNSCQCSRALHQDHQKMIYDRVRFNRAGWASMLTPALKQ